MAGMVTITCITKAEPFAERFLREMVDLARLVRGNTVLVADGHAAQTQIRKWGLPLAGVVQSKGYIESVLDQAISLCREGYILRLDDDEACSSSMCAWLESREFLASGHWKFPRLHLWRNDQTAIINAPLWPDHQTRLSLKAYSGGRTTVHAGSPHGGGTPAPVAIEHHKFLVKSPEERLEIAKRYDMFREGYGTGGMLPFQLPERVWQDHEMELSPADILEGTCR